MGLRVALARTKLILILVCCIYHAPRGLDESSDESSSDSDSDDGESDADDDGSARPPEEIDINMNMAMAIPMITDMRNAKETSEQGVRMHMRRFPHKRVAGIIDEQSAG